MAEPSKPGPGALVIVRSLIYAGVFYVVTALYLVLGSWLLIGPRRWAMKGLEVHGRTCVLLLRLICGTKLEVRGHENLPKSGCLVVAKHQSAWDSFGLVPLFRDPAIVLKDELKWIPFYGWFCVKFEHILVKREKASVALKTMIRDARQRIGIGREVVIFPEGTRMAPGAAPDYKPGYVALYEALGVVDRAAGPELGPVLAEAEPVALSRNDRRRVPPRPAARAAARRVSHPHRNRDRGREPAADRGSSGFA